MPTSQRRGLRLLSFDGGGPRVLSQLLIVNELMKRLQADLNLDEIPKPCNYFDMIIGVGLGGLIALLLGRLGMTVSDAINAYMDLTKVVFENDGADTSRAIYRSRRFESAFKSVLRQHKLDTSTKMEDHDGVCKTVVCATSTDNLSQCTLLRSYRGRSHSTITCTVLEAACATTASPILFKPARIDGIEFVSSGFGFSNPLNEALREAQEVFGRDTLVGCLVSIGVGKGEATSLRSLSESTNDLEVSCFKMCMDAEKSHEEFQHRFHQVGVYFRFNVDRGLERPIIGEWKDFGNTISHTSAYLQEGLVTQRIDLAVQALHVKANGPAIAVLCSPNVVDTLPKARPSVSPHFIGRETILESLFEQHFEFRTPNAWGPNLSILSGWGGAGKTQISLRFSDEYERRYPNRPILFLDARSKERLEAELEEFIRSRGPAYRTSSYSTAISYLSTEMLQWLIIFDNADDPSFDLLPYMPRSSKGSIIMTTRNEQYGALAPHAHYKIEELATEEAIRLLLQSSNYSQTKSNLDLALEIVEEVGCLALAIAQAAGYIFIHKCLHKYLSIYRQNRRALLSSTPRVDHYRVSLYSALFASFGKLSRAQQDILRLFSCLHFSSISESMVSRSAEHGFQYIQPWDSPLFPSDFEEQTSQLLAIFYPSGIWSEYGYNELIGGIQKYGLLQVNITGEHSKSYTMHLLVQNFLHDQMEPPMLNHFQTLSTRLWSTQIETDHRIHKLGLCRELVPHLRLALTHSRISIIDMIVAASILYNLGDYRESLKLYETVKVLVDQISDPLPGLDIMELSLGDLYMLLEDFRAAEEMYRAYLEKFPGGPFTLFTMNQITDIYSRQGRFADAYASGKRGLETMKYLMKESAPEAINSIIVAALAAQDVNRIEEAAELASTALSRAETFLEESDPVRLRAMTTVSRILRGQGDSVSAYNSEMAVLEKFEKVYGKDHPHTWRIMGRVGICLQELKRYAEAEWYFRTSLQNYHKAFGLTDHSIAARKYLISLYRELGRHEEADTFGLARDNGI